MSDRVVAYVADQTHSSVARAARLLGFRPDQLRVLPTDAGHRLRLDALIGAVDADRRAGLTPLIVAANAGATNTGAVDPLAELAEVCRDRGLWLHVDAAYGGFAALSERGRAELRGIGLADSVTLDPHKWLYQPIECGSLLVREGHLLRDAFTINPDYLADYKSEEVNFADLGLQLTRTSRALKVWLSINYFGLDAFRRAIDRAIELAHAAERQVRDSPTLELLSPASLGIICFGRRFGGVDDDETIERLNLALVRDFEATGQGLVSSTRLHGTYALRLCVMNHTSGPAEVGGALSWFANAPEPPHAAPISPRAYEDATADVRGGWADEGLLDEVTVRRVPLFAELGDEALRVILKSAREMLVQPGGVVVMRWQGTRPLLCDPQRQRRGAGRDRGFPRNESGGALRRACRARLGRGVRLRKDGDSAGEGAAAPARPAADGAGRGRQARARCRPCTSRRRARASAAAVGDDAVAIPATATATAASGRSCTRTGRLWRVRSRSSRRAGCSR